MASRSKSRGLLQVALAFPFLALKQPIPDANYPAYLGTTPCRLDHQNVVSTHPHRNILATRNTHFGFQVSLLKIDIEIMGQDRGPIFDNDGKAEIYVEEENGLFCLDIPPPGTDPSAAFGRKVTFTHKIYKKGHPDKEKSPKTITLKEPRGFSFHRIIPFAKEILLAKEIPFAKGIVGMKVGGQRRIILSEDQRTAYDVNLTHVKE